MIIIYYFTEIFWIPFQEAVDHEDVSAHVFATFLECQETPQERQKRLGRERQAKYR
jgi:hypothetical protein